MSSFIPKEKLTAYQRWELAAFDEAEQVAKAAAEEAAAAEAASGNTQFALPTAEEIERIHSEAQETGYAAGHEAGHAAGYEAGLAKAEAEAAQLAALGENLVGHLKELDQQVAENLLAVAVETARQVLRQSLRLKPELLLPVVREAVTSMPLHHGHPLLFLNPADAALVRQHLGEQLAHNGWRILEDAGVTCGGCRIEIGTSEVDATLETRWRRVLDAIGTSADWLDDRP